MKSNYVDLDRYDNYSDPQSYRQVSMTEVYYQYGFKGRASHFSNTHWIGIL